MKCSSCNKHKTRKNTKYFKDGKRWRYYYLCRQCENKAEANRRANRANRAKYLLRDSRRQDHEARRKNDLTLEFIQGLISSPCSYCGDHNLIKTLDRIDNTRGHTQDNVVVSCLRCNLIRRDCPYEAWLLFRGVVRQARMRGLFGDWGTAVRRKDAK